MQSTHKKRVQFRFEQERPAKRQRVDAAITRRAVASNELEYDQSTVDDRRYELIGELMPASAGLSPHSGKETARTRDETPNIQMTSDAHSNAPVAMSGLLGSVRLPRSAALGNFVSFR